MGTRNLLILRKIGEYKAKYCQWDGYPSGQGLSTLEFLNKHSVETLHQIFDKLVTITQDEVNGIYQRFGKLDTDEQYEAFKQRYPTITRDFGGGKFLAIVAASADYLPLYNYIEFAADSLFCEWAYLIDLDEGVLDVYEGFNKEPLHESHRFAFLNDKRDMKSEYYPVKFKAGWLLSHLPLEAEFLARLEDDEE